METNNIYQIVDDLQAFAENLGSGYMLEKVAQLEAHIAVLEMQSNK